MKISAKRFFYTVAILTLAAAPAFAQSASGGSAGSSGSMSAGGSTSGTGTTGGSLNAGASTGINSDASTGINTGASTGINTGATASANSGANAGASAAINSADRATLTDYIHEMPASVRSTAAARDQYRIGQTLPGSVQSSALPSTLNNRITSAPSGYSYVQSGTNIYLISNANRRIVDRVGIR